MGQEYSIEVKDVKKKFKVYLDKGSQLKERILFQSRNKYEDRWVLNGVSFKVKKGEAIGLIGHNGCGKSTTLKLLTKIMYPNSGSVELKGRVSSLIELGAGFHPDMSGRENIYTNASIFGLSRKEIDKRMDDIIQFSEMAEFLDNPVRTYSSGMYMRLAFSVAINVDADILLIDEILAVGDVNFQTKCFEKLREIKAKGTTIVIVSHSLAQIEQICDRSIWLQDGLLRAEGSPYDVHPEYLAYMGEKRQEILEQESEKSNSEVEKDNEKNRWGNGNARIQQIELTNQDGVKQKVFAVGDDINIKIKYMVSEYVADAVVGIGIFRSDGVHCYGTNTRIDKLKKYNLNQDGEICIKLQNVKLLQGDYSIDLAIESGVSTPVDYYREATTFSIYSVLQDIGISRIEHQWSGIE